MPQTPPRHHADWLSLLEISGPFLSMPVLLNAFPQGLDDFPPEEARSLRADYEYWKENASDPATHTAWVRLVLESMLGYTGAVLLSGQAIPGGLKAEFPEHEETLRPDLMLAEPGTHKPRLLIQVYPPGQSLEKTLARQPLAGLGRHAHDGTAARHRDPAGAGDQRRAVDAGGRAARRDDRLHHLVRRPVVRRAAHAARLPQLC